MSADLDFSSLYRELRLTPPASLTDVKLAYRRRVAELHPDRIRDASNAAQAATQLQQLTRLYNQALDFQHRYGRLPGSQGSPSTQRRSDIPRSPSMMPMPPRRRSWLWWACGLGLLCSAPFLVELTLTEPEPDAPAYQAPDTEEAPATTRLQLGMNRALVRTVQGAPYLDAGDRWEYGPSWLLFDHDTLVAWYSSPLNPLKVATSEPTHADEAALATARQNRRRD